MNILLLAITAVLCIGAPVAAADSVRFGTAVKVNPLYTLPMLAGEERGIWKQYGLEVSWFPFDGAVGLNRAAAAGAVDLGFQATISALAAIVRGLPVLVIAESGSRQDFYFYVKTGSPIREPRDLRGAKIGFSSFGGAAHNFAQLAIKALGLERDVNSWPLEG